MMNDVTFFEYKAQIYELKNRQSDDDICQSVKINSNATFSQHSHPDLQVPHAIA